MSVWNEGARRAAAGQARDRGISRQSVKYGVLGAPPKVVRVWLAGNGPVERLTDLYGDEEGGFVGGYRTRPEENVFVGLNAGTCHVPIHSDRN